MARVPVIERAWGQDELARLHRLVGFGSFNLMLAHIVLIGLGYAGSGAHGYSGLLGELWDITWGLPGMLLAAAGALCLVLVVVTSIRAARRRLRYESWHLMHLYAYLGVGSRCRISCGLAAISSPTRWPPRTGGPRGPVPPPPGSSSGSGCRCAGRCDTGWSCRPSSPRCPVSSRCI